MTEILKNVEPFCMNFRKFRNRVYEFVNRPFSYSTKEPGSSDIFIQLYARGSKKWRRSFDHNCKHSKILQNVMKYRSIYIVCFQFVLSGLVRISSY